MTWAIPEGYIPGQSTGPAPAMQSHETICFLNTAEEDANVRVTIFFCGAGASWPISIHGTGAPYPTRAL
jgi:hypothetical protein